MLLIVVAIQFPADASVPASIAHVDPSRGCHCLCSMLLPLPLLLVCCLQSSTSPQCPSSICSCCCLSEISGSPSDAEWFALKVCGTSMNELVDSYFGAPVIIKLV